MFDPATAAKKKALTGAKKTAQTNIKAWVMEFLPEPIRPEIQSISIAEFQCGDPSCSPVDTGITLMLKNGENLSQGIPAEMHEVTKDQVRQTVGMILEPPGQPAKPQMSADGQEVFQSIINGMFTKLDSLPTQQKMLVCDNVLEAVDNYQYALMKQMQARAKSNQQGNSILSAAQKNDVGALATQIASGIDPSFSNSVGQTALHVAVLWGNVEATAFLIENGADVNKRNELGASTPLHTLAQSPKPVEGRLQCAALLLSAGADPEARDGREFTALEIAREQGEEAIVTYLTKIAGGASEAEAGVMEEGTDGFDISAEEADEAEAADEQGESGGGQRGGVERASEQASKRAKRQNKFGARTAEELGEVTRDRPKGQPGWLRTVAYVWRVVVVSGGGRES
eukprot:CAMPEP_0182557610 /NCGR_PEP_ID=MMETSP1324-20130603/1453_1 /TAXON_ID=236786 /ORGANISM="Florenciella sp., Strain RCC1587" /LENGTH=397 /DNA_ID=CAMNT_0024769687 /DNA_START=38 /DNA_END=1233 /DNA_ORIENTATION=+